MFINIMEKKMKNMKQYQLKIKRLNVPVHILKRAFKYSANIRY